MTGYHVERISSDLSPVDDRVGLLAPARWVLSIIARLLGVTLVVREPQDEEWVFVRSDQVGNHAR